MTDSWTAGVCLSRKRIGICTLPDAKPQDYLLHGNIEERQKW